MDLNTNVLMVDFVARYQMCFLTGHDECPTCHVAIRVWDDILT